MPMPDLKSRPALQPPAEQASILLCLGASGRGQPATGPLQSLRSLVSGLSGEFRLTLAAREALRPASEAHLDLNTLVYDGQIRYFWRTDSHSRENSISRILSTVGPDVTVLNSFFDREFTLPALILRKLGRIPRVPTILSPRGEFAGGALSLKSGRKRAYLSMVKRLGLTRDLWFHATEPHEVKDIRQTGLPCRGILEAPNPRRWFERPSVPALGEGPDTPLRLAFLGRITPVKNVAFAIETMAQVKVPAALDLFGPIADETYWRQCTDAIARLPAHVSVTAKGVLANDAVPETLAEYDLFFLPTLGENFGHAINEALMSGVPALIADTTPWRELEANRAGWDLPIADPAPFADVIDRFAAMDVAARQRYRDGARALAERRYGESDAIEAHRRMFRYVLEMGV